MNFSSTTDFIRLVSKQRNSMEFFNVTEHFSLAAFLKFILRIFRHEITSSQQVNAAKVRHVERRRIVKIKSFNRQKLFMW